MMKPTQDKNPFYTKEELKEIEQNMKKYRKLNKYDSVREWNPKMRRPKDLTEEDKEELEKNPLDWLCNNVGREIRLPKEEYFYLIRTEARPLDVMDSAHFIGGKHYEGDAITLTKQQLEWTLKLLEATKDIIDCESFRNKLKEILNNENK